MLTKSAKSKSLYSTETPDPRKNLHVGSGISDADFNEYDTKMYRHKQLMRGAKGLAMGAFGAYMLRQPGIIAKGVGKLLGAPMDPQSLKALGRMGKAMRYGALGTASLAMAHKYDAMDKDPVYKGEDVAYKAMKNIINPQTNLERYYADYARDVEPMAKQINMSKAASVTDPEVLGMGALTVGVPWYAKRKLWHAAMNNTGAFGKYIPYMRIASKFFR